jgi:uncharacterized MAPEG superfamily protein
MLTILICLLIVMVMPLALAISTVPFRVSQFGKPDFQQPRRQAEQLVGVGYRIYAAQKNAWEALLLFSAALVFVSLAGIDFNDLMSAAIIFVAARMLHAVFYILNIGSLRFIAFLASVASVGWIVVMAFTSLS